MNLAGGDTAGARAGRGLVDYTPEEDAELVRRTRFGDGAVGERSASSSASRRVRLRRRGVAVPYLRRPFTPEEDAALLDGVPLAELAEETGRFVQALSKRRKVLRERAALR